MLRKVRDLSDAEFDAVLGGSWEDAIPYYTGQDSALTSVLTWLGFRGKPGAEYAGLMGTLMRLAEGRKAERTAGAEEAALLQKPLAEYSVVEDYRWNRAASEHPVVAALVWWLALSALGWAVWPVCFALFTSRVIAAILSAELLDGWQPGGCCGIWQAMAQRKTGSFTPGYAPVLWRVWGPCLPYANTAMGKFVAEKWPMLVAGEAGVAVAYIAFLLMRMANPDLWQPWFGGEKFMEFAFLNGILRSASFPPVDPHFAGGYINYYYFGIYLSAYLIKLTGIYAETAFNLTIASLFALTVSNAFSVAYSAWAWRRQDGGSVLSWRSGFWAAWIAPLFVAVIGNLDGFAQVVRRLAETSTHQATSAFSLVPMLTGATAALGDVLAGRRSMPAYDFWAPSRVIPNTINEFPYWSFLFADLHPHLIGIPVAILFCAAILALLGQANRERAGSAGLVLFLAFLLGTLSSVNLWELPTHSRQGAGVPGCAVPG